MRAFLLTALFVFSTQAFAGVQYLKLEGSVAGVPNSDLLQEILTNFVVPLQQNKDVALFTFVVNVGGQGKYFFHFVAEPVNAQASNAFNQYIAKFQAQSFHGVAIHFQNVVQIFEVTTLQTGNYVDNQDDPFNINFEVSQKHAFASLLEWQNFTDTYGWALLSSDHATFKAYLGQFVSDPDDFAAASKALTLSNMMAIDPRVYLILDDETVIDGDMAHSPFIPFRFFRNCYESRFENGFCF